MRWVVALFAITSALTAQSAEKSNSPYIDEIRAGMESEASPAPTDAKTADPYLQSIKKRLEEKEKAEGPQESYIEYLKKSEIEVEGQKPETSYIETERARLKPVETGGAILAVQEGRSALQAKRSGAIHHALGFRYGASLSREITAAAGTSQRNFNELYGGNYAPDLTLFYEYQPFHSEWFGNVGIVASLGLGYYHGAGVFEVNLPKPGGGFFGTEAHTQFQFFSIPVTAGLNYRFNLFRYIRPFVMGGPSLIGYYEMRNDGGDNHSGYSKGLWFAGGVSILMDWVSGTSSWDLYAEHGVKHYYLTMDYSRLSTISSDVNFAVSGVYAGLTFEF